MVTGMLMKSFGEEVKESVEWDIQLCCVSMSSREAGKGLMLFDHDGFPTLALLPWTPLIWRALTTKN